MSTITTPVSTANASAPPRSDVDVLVQDQKDGIAIPGWIHDLESYRRWAHSDGYPEHGWVSFLNGRIWVDYSMEEFLHNRVKGAFAFAVMSLLRLQSLGAFVHDRMLFSNAAANLSTEPDGMFVTVHHQEGRQGQDRLLR